MENVILVLLAAGNSRRFQGNKLLHLFQGKPMYQYLTEAVETLPEDLFEEKIVVTQYQAIAEDLEKRGYQVVENHESELGISHSIHLALHKAADHPDAAVCFAVCDQPYLKAETVERLVTEWRPSGKGIGCLSHQGELGNPAIFSPAYREELLALKGDVGGRLVIRHHLEDLFLCEAADGRELKDIDVKPAVCVEK